MSNQNSELKNPIFWCFVAIVAGIGLGIWGWDKNESTIPERTVGAVPMIVVACLLIAGGLFGFFTFGNKRKS